MNKKERKVLAKIEQEFRSTLNSCFVETMMRLVPMNSDIKVPNKRKVINTMKAEFDASNSLLMSAMIEVFVNERYVHIESMRKNMKEVK